MSGAAWFELAQHDGYIFENARQNDAVIRTALETQRILLGSSHESNALLVLDGRNLTVNDLARIQHLKAPYISPLSDTLNFIGNDVVFSNSRTRFMNETQFDGAISVNELYVNDNLLLDSNGKLQVKRLISDGSLGTAKIADGAITNVKIAPGTLETDAYGDESITGAKIDAYTLPSRVFQDRSIPERAIADRALIERHFADGSIPGRALAGSAVGTGALANGSILSQHLGPDLRLSGDVTIGNKLSVPDLVILNGIELNGIDIGTESFGIHLKQTGLTVDEGIRFSGDLATHDGTPWRPTQWCNIGSGKIAYDAGDVRAGQALEVGHDLMVGSNLYMGSATLKGGTGGDLILSSGAFDIAGGSLYVNGAQVVEASTRNVKNVGDLSVNGDAYIAGDLSGLSNMRLDTSTAMFNPYHMHVSSKGVQEGAGAINTRYYKLAVLRSIAEINNFGALTIEGELSGGATYESAGYVRIVIANRNASESKPAHELVATSVWGGKPAQIASGTDLVLYEDTSTGRFLVYLKTSLNSTFNITLRGGDVIANYALVYDWPDTVSYNLAPDEQTGQESYEYVCSLVDHRHASLFPYAGGARFRGPVRFDQPISVATSNLDVGPTLHLSDEDAAQTAFVTTNAHRNQGGSWVGDKEGEHALQLRMDRDQANFWFGGTQDRVTGSGAGVGFDAWCKIDSSGLVPPLACGATKFEPTHLAIQDQNNARTLYGVTLSFANLSTDQAEWVPLLKADTSPGAVQAFCDVEGSVFYTGQGSAAFAAQMYLAGVTDETRVALVSASADTRTDPFLQTVDICARYDGEGKLYIYVRSRASVPLTLVLERLTLVTPNDVHKLTPTREVRTYEPDSASFVIAAALSEPDIYQVRDLKRGWTGMNTFAPSDTLHVGKGGIQADRLRIGSNYKWDSASGLLRLNELDVFDPNGKLLTYNAIGPESLTFNQLSSNARSNIWHMVVRSNLAASGEEGQGIVEIPQLEMGRASLTGTDPNQDQSHLVIGTAPGETPLPFALSLNGSLNLLGSNTAVFRDGQPWKTSPWTSNIDHISYGSNVIIGGDVQVGGRLATSHLHAEGTDIVLGACNLISLSADEIDYAGKRLLMRDDGEIDLENLRATHTQNLNVSSNVSVTGDVLLSPDSRILVDGNPANPFTNLWERGPSNTAVYPAGDVHVKEGNLYVAKQLRFGSNAAHLEWDGNQVVCDSDLRAPALKLGYNGPRFAARGSNTGLYLSGSEPLATFHVGGDLAVRDGPVISAQQDLVNVRSITGQAPFVMQPDGKVGINNVSPVHELTVNGTIGLQGSVGTLRISNDALHVRGGTKGILLKSPVTCASNLECTASVKCDQDIQAGVKVEAPVLETSHVRALDDTLLLNQGFAVNTSQGIHDVGSNFSLTSNLCKFPDCEVTGLLTAQYMKPIVFGPPNERELQINVTAPVGDSIVRSTDTEQPGFATLCNLLAESLPQAVCLVDRGDKQNMYMAATNYQGSKTFMNIAYQPISSNVAPLPSYSNLALDAYVLDPRRDTSTFMGDLRVVGPTGFEAVGPKNEATIRARAFNTSNYAQNFVEIGVMSNAHLTSDRPLDISTTGGVTQAMRIDENNNIHIPGTVKFGLNTLSGGDLKQVYADAAGNLTTSVSDARLKRDIAPLAYTPDKIMNLKPSTFRFADQEKRDLGLIAQEVEEICPECVGVDGLGQKYVSYDKFVPLLIAGLKDAYACINGLNKKIESYCIQSM